MKTKTYYSNLLLGCILLFASLVLIVDAAKAIDQTKVFCYDPYTCGEAKTWGVWQSGQYYKTTTNVQWYRLGVKGKGWQCCDGLAQWFLNWSEYYECFWCTQNTSVFISEWEGVSNGKHYSQRFQSSSLINIYTSEDDDWDTATCFSNVNNSSCH